MKWAVRGWQAPQPHVVPPTLGLERIITSGSGSVERWANAHGDVAIAVPEDTLRGRRIAMSTEVAGARLGRV